MDQRSVADGRKVRSSELPRRRRLPRPYIDHPAAYWTCGVPGCCFAAINPIPHPCPFPPGPAVERDRAPVPLAVLARVRDGLAALPDGRPDAPAAPSVFAEVAALARRSRVARPEAWAPAEVNEPSPDVVTTAPLPVVGAGGAA